MKPCLTLFDSAGRGVDGTGKDCRTPDLYHRGWCRVNSVGSTFGFWAVAFSRFIAWIDNA